MRENAPPGDVAAGRHAARGDPARAAGGELDARGGAGERRYGEPPEAQRLEVCPSDGVKRSRLVVLAVNHRHEALAPAQAAVRPRAHLQRREGCERD